MTALTALIAMTGIAAAQPGAGGVCGTPIVGLIEWASLTGQELIFLAGLVFGAYKHARAVLTPNPERASHYRAVGTAALFAGPIFTSVIVLGEQAATATGLTVADCANLTPWI